MNVKLLLAVAAFVVSPALAMAACSGHTEQVMTCADGMVYDAETNACIVMSS